MLPAWCIIIAVALRLAGGAGYSWAVIKGRARPNPVSWFFWGLAPLIAFFAQLHEGVGPEAWVTLALAVGPLIVFVLALAKHHSAAYFTPMTVLCAVVAATGLLLWRLTNDPVLAIVFSIVADVFASIPTIIKGYRNSSSEVVLPYLLSIVSMVITLLTLTSWTFASYVFPLYILAINCIIFGAISIRRPATLDNATIPRRLLK